MTHPALSIAKSGLDAQQIRAAATANNLANAGTMGFKSEKPIFTELMYQKVRQPGGLSTNGTELPSGLMLGTGVNVAGTIKSFKSGSPMQSEGAFDMFIKGRGFFQVLQSDGTIAYTRNGNFQTDNTGNLVDTQGRKLQPTITMPSSVQSVTIGTDGTVSVMTAGANATTTVGTVQLADFMNPTGLEPIGDSLFLQTASSGSPIVGNPSQSGMGSIEQSKLEGSNVNVVEELVALIDGQRNYEMNAKAIETVDNMLQFAAQVL